VCEEGNVLLDLGLAEVKEWFLRWAKRWMAVNSSIGSHSHLKRDIGFVWGE
jgi:hypothetical protein